MKKFVSILTVVLVIGCIVTGVVNGKMWGANQDPPVVESYKKENPTETISDIPYAATYGTEYDENGSNDTPQTQNDGEIETQENGSYPEVADADVPGKEPPAYEGRFIMTAETTELIGYKGKRTYFLTMNSGGTFSIRTDYEVDGQYEYEMHSGIYEAVSKNKIDMKLTTYETSIPDKFDEYKYKDAKTVRVNFKDNKLTCKQGKKKYEFEKLL